MSDLVTVGAVQLEAVHGEVRTNLAAIEELAAAAAADGARLVVTPEMALTGYLWPDEESVRGLAEPVDGPSVRRLAGLCRTIGAWLVLGLPELDPDLGTLHNSCVLIGPDGPVGSYRKTQPFVADPRWAVDGHLRPPVWDTPAGRVSPLICADVDHPEPMRYAALSGADWVALPTAWVDEPGPSATWRLRAWENGLPMVAADMAGAEPLDGATVQFSGGTCVLDHSGNVTAALDGGTGYVTATLDLAEAAAVRRARLKARRPAEYRPLARSSTWPRSDHEALSDRPTRTEPVVGAVFSGPPGVPPAAPEGTRLAVLPAFHLTGGRPDPEQDAAARRVLWDWCAAGRCEAVTALAVRDEDGRPRYAVVHCTPEGRMAVRYATHLGAQAAWAAPGAEPPRPVQRPWGTLGLLAAEELEAFEPSRVLAVLGADVIAAPGAVDWPFPVPFAGTRVPLEPALLREPDSEFAHPARLRAGDSHVWIAMANAGRVPGGLFSPDHVTVPRTEAVADGPGWTVLDCPLVGREGPGVVCAAKPQLARRRTDLYGAAMLRGPRRV
ncbi:Predicted amidohydrolase [Thermomonospora echinospora]|uniref:Predicted amidohydrolase n=1 Tax=Thermomonospora echinospora TaxID=1992 RepID=A0A1H6EBH8_9ACTN|nr:nitrilase-related carbon-nitrogen hydrolase [Thermomonospora echinospora]SEG94399.1 Predicted amidohydrolase [Thermomonospora echinospora]